MSPILGTLASQFSGKPFTSFESIQTVNVGSGGASQIVFSSIPQTYTHLQIRGIGGTVDATGVRDAGIEFNSDTGQNYSRHWLYTFGSSVGALSSTDQPYYGYGYMAGTDSGSNVRTPAIIDILDYTNTNKHKTVRTLSGNDRVSTGNSVVVFSSGLWLSTSAITNIRIFLTSGNIAQYSSFSLYGIKGA
jgi:hypothetical protein